jgi:sigma-B regulation protein RsbU (phosphoserine phosphatase)
VDQFGGPDNNSFNLDRFSELLRSISKLPPAEQCSILDRNMNEWKGSARQLDDILVIGINL